MDCYDKHNRIVVKSESLYDYYIDRQGAPSVLVLRDLDMPDTDKALRGDGPYRSLTNNLSMVLEEVRRAVGEDAGKLPIIYRDTRMIYDGVSWGKTPIAYNLVAGQLTTDEAVALASVRRWAAYFDYLSENIESAKGRGNDD